MFMVKMSSIGQIGAASVQMQMGAWLWNGDAPQLRFGVKKTTAIPVHCTTQIADWIVAVLVWQWPESIVLQDVANALIRG